MIALKKIQSPFDRTLNKIFDNYYTTLNNECYRYYIFKLNLETTLNLSLMDTIRSCHFFPIYSHNNYVKHDSLM